MLKANHGGMEGLAFEGSDGGGGVTGNACRAPGPPVKLVAHQGMPKIRHMYSDLVGASGSEPAFHETGHRWIAFAQGADEAITGDGGLSSPWQDCHLLPVFRIAADIAADFTLRGVGNATHHGQIGAFHTVIGKLFGQGGMGDVSLGGHHKATGILIETVDDAGPLDSADARQGIAAMSEKSIDQSAVRVAGCGMHNQPRRFVDDDELVIFVNHMKGNVLGPGRRLFGLRHDNMEFLAGFDFECGVFDRVLTTCHMTVGDELLQP